MSRKLIDIRNTIPKHPTLKWKKRKLVNSIYIHTSASENQDPNTTALYHITPGPNNHLSKKGAPGLAYHDFIDKEGICYHCNDYTDITWHTKGSNSNSIGIVMAFRGQDNILPTEKQFLALKQHLTIVCLYMNINPLSIFGHREAPGFSFLDKGIVKYKKVCPGLAIDLDLLREDICYRLQSRLQMEKLFKKQPSNQWNIEAQIALDMFYKLKG